MGTVISESFFDETADEKLFGKLFFCGVALLILIGYIFGLE
jgi:hypothetical protein